MDGATLMYFIRMLRIFSFIGPSVHLLGNALSRAEQRDWLVDHVPTGSEQG
jgi:hypothetical protein